MITRLVLAICLRVVIRIKIGMSGFGLRGQVGRCEWGGRWWDRKRRTSRSGGAWDGSDG